MTDLHFERLLRAHALGELTTAEAEQLAALAAAQPARRRRLQAADSVHGALRSESALLATVQRPTEPVEEADETFERLQRVAAAAGERLRARMLHTPAPTAVLAPRAVPPGRRRAVLVGLLAAAGLAAAAFVALRGRDVAPALLTDRPADQVAGGRVQMLLIEPTLSASDPRLSWAPVAGADGYDAVIVDAHGIVLQRDANQRRSTQWALTPAEVLGLRAHGQLLLRVAAKDGADVTIGSSGDLPLTLR